MGDRVRFVFSPREGLFALWLGNRYFKLKAPWNDPLPSERYGRDRVLLRLRGWRLMVRNG